MGKSCSDIVFECQVDACKEFFQDELPRGQFKLIAEGDRPDNMKRFKGPIYDITGFDARQVVAVLSDIVNDRNQFTKNNTFYLLIRNTLEDTSQAGFEELFRLTARPTEHQPGNAIVLLRPRGIKVFTQSAKSYEELKGALEAHYETNTTSFAEDIKELFKNNAQNKDLPQATTEAYMILLFEIARRLVKLDNPSDKKKALDSLPIGSAIARLIQLLELGDEETCTFEDVFLPGHRFHCFTGKPKDRRKAIDNINKAICNITNASIVTVKDLRNQLVCTYVCPTVVQSVVPNVVQSVVPTVVQSVVPTVVQSVVPNVVQSVVPTVVQSVVPNVVPTVVQSVVPNVVQSVVPTVVQSVVPKVVQSVVPKVVQSVVPTVVQSVVPTMVQSVVPTMVQSVVPTMVQSVVPTVVQSVVPNVVQSAVPCMPAGLHMCLPAA